MKFEVQDPSDERNCISKKPDCKENEKILPVETSGQSVFKCQECEPYTKLNYDETSCSVPKCKKSEKVLQNGKC